MEQQEKQDKTIRKLKKQLKVYMKKVEDFEGSVLHHPKNKLLQPASTSCDVSCLCVCVQPMLS